MIVRSAVAVAFAAGLACTATPAAQQMPSIGRGVTVLDVPVGGLTSEPARQRIETSFARPITILHDRERLTVTPQRLGAGAAVNAAVTSALAATPGSEIGLPVSFSKRSIESYVDWLARRYYRAPENARLIGASEAGPTIVEGKTGLAIEKRTMRRALEQLLTTGTRAPLQLLTKPVEPKVTRATYGQVIVIRRGGNSLKLYDSTNLVRAFGVATGQARYPTPSGIFNIVDKQRNPWWLPPQSDWAKGLKPVPPGPGNPLGTRWMGLTAPGVGIHGTPDDASIGYSASHGCIRMHVPDAEWLFDHVDYGTPVVIL